MGESKGRGVGKHWGEVWGSVGERCKVSVKGMGKCLEGVGKVRGSGRR